MSDLVRYPVGNTVNRDLINWPTILRSEIDGLFPGMTEDEKDQQWPVDVSLAQIMALVWRVKKWRLTGSFEVTINYVQTEFPAHSIIGAGEAEFAADTFLMVLKDGGLEATREQNLVGKLFFMSPYFALVNNGTGSLNAPVLDWELNFTVPAGSASGSTPTAQIGPLFMSFNGGFHLFDSGPGSFAPPFDSTIGINVPQGGGGIASGLIFSVGFHRNPVTLLSRTGPGVLTAPGEMIIKPLITSDITVPMQVAWRLPGMAVGSTTTGTGSADLTLEAVEYWPFANSENLPVYDSSTGTQLRDPFS